MAPDDVQEVEQEVNSAVLEPSNKPDDYASLKEDFAQIISRGMDGFQEETPGRTVEYISLRVHGRYGIIVETTDRGLLKMTELSSPETDNQGRTKMQRMFMGMSCNTVTTGNAFKSVNLLGHGDTTAKEFEVNAGAYELVKKTIEAAQKDGEKVQRKIDEEEYEHYSLHKDEPVNKLSANFDADGLPPSGLVFELVTLARQTAKLKLGAKLEDCKAFFFSIVDTNELADSKGNQADYSMPRTGIGMQIKTTRGSEVYEVVRGTGGINALKRYSPEKSLEDVVVGLAEDAAKQATDLDCARDASILGDECHIVLGPRPTGVLIHECYGHPMECIAGSRYIPIMLDNQISISTPAELYDRLSRMNLPQKGSNIDTSSIDLKTLSTDKTPELFDEQRLDFVLTDDQKEYFTNPQRLYNRKNIASYNVLCAPKFTGRWKKVSAVGQRPNKQCRHIYNETGETIVSSDHPVTSYNLGKFYTTPAAQFQDQQFASLVSIPQAKYQLPPQYNETPKQVEALCRFVGAFIAKGSLDNRQEYVKIHNCDLKWLESLAKDMKLLDKNLKPKIQISHEANGNHKTAYTLWCSTKHCNNELYNAIKTWCTVTPSDPEAHPARSKKLPDWTYNLPPQLQQTMLNTLYYGDGHSIRHWASKNYSKNAYTDMPSYTTTSLALASGLCMVLTQLGKYYSIDTNTQHGSYTINQSVHCGGHKTASKFHNNDCHYDEALYDLTVEDSHMFVDACGLVLLHNSDIIIENKRDKNVDLNLKARLGSQVSENSKFNMIDDGNSTIVLNGKEFPNCFGALVLDDESTPAKCTQLVKDGIQVRPLSSAATLNEITTGLQDDVKENIISHGLSGNLRSQKYDKEPLVRMTNTFCLPNPEGPKSVDELAAKIPPNKKGVYIVSVTGGQVNTSNGNFKIFGQLGYLIENGAITDKPVKDIVIRGNIAKFGNKIKEIGSVETMTTTFSGMCGKNSAWVPVDGGGPAILIEDATVGSNLPSWPWVQIYKEYARQAEEVTNKQRRKSEVHYRFVEDMDEEPSSDHSNICLVACSIPVKDELRLIAGLDPSSHDFLLGENGDLVNG